MIDKRLVLFVSGDFYDTPSPVLALPEGMDLAAEKESYDVWLRTKRKDMGYTKYLNFVEWLVAFRGVVDADLDIYDYS